MKKKDFVIGIFSVLSLGLLATMTKGSWYSPTIDIGDPDLIGYWEFESVDASNVTTDSSGYGNDGELIGFDCDPADCNLTTARYGNGLIFDGTDGKYIDTVDLSGYGTKQIGDYSDFSVSVWIKPDNIVNGVKTVIGNHYDEGSVGNGFVIFHQDGNLLINYANDYDTGFNVAVGNWYHIVLVKNSTNHTNTYVNGNLINQALRNSGLGNNITTGRVLRIGNEFKTASWTKGYNGTIDDVRIYNRSLTDAEVKELYSCRVPDSSGWIVNGNCNIDSEDINKPALSLDITSTGVVNMINNSLTVDKITIANGGKLIKDNNSTYYVV